MSNLLGQPSNSPIMNSLHHLCCLFNNKHLNLNTRSVNRGFAGVTKPVRGPTLFRPYANLASGLRKINQCPTEASKAALLRREVV